MTVVDALVVMKMAPGDFQDQDRNLVLWMEAIQVLQGRFNELRDDKSYRSEVEV
jgi:hypothetical protein